MFDKFIAETPTEFQPTSVTKETYLDLLEIVFSAYSLDAIMARKKIDGSYLELQPYSRLTVILACLLSGGRMPERFSLWEHMMTQCCRELPTLTKEAHFADFSVKEILFALKLMSPFISEAQRDIWHAELRQVDPYKNFRWVIRSPEDKNHLHNINIYNMVGEWLRETEGLTNTTAYFAAHWPVQLGRFDENGMYRDPNNPVLYDLTTRCQIQLMLHYGYRGTFYPEIDANLRKGGVMTLLLQSAAFEFPYGGRSNQFIFNEILIATNCEYEAVRYKTEGDIKRAGAFKRCGHLALLAIRRWIDEHPPRHIKNFYPVESKYGTEHYASYDSYMCTMGAFLAMGYVFADDSIKEMPCPAEVGGYVFETSPDFHKIVANAAGYSVEIDTNADRGYDATGLGRLHRRHIPTELALSMPLGGTNYHLPDHLSRMWSAITPGWKRKDGSIQYLSDLSEGLVHELNILEENRKMVRFTLKYTEGGIEGHNALLEHYELNQDGLRYHVEVVHPEMREIFVKVPLLYTNGKDITCIDTHDAAITVMLGVYRYKVVHNGYAILHKETNYGNRNGEYSIAVIAAHDSSLSLWFTLEKIEP